MSLKTDSELIKEFNEGKIEGFNELVRRYQKKIYWVARRIIDSHEDADDIVQDVFLKVYEKLTHFRGESEFYTWLYRIATNTSFNALNKRKFKDLFRSNEVEQSIDHEGYPDSNLLNEEYRSILDDAIATLPKQQKAVFHLRYVDELPYQEIAKILKRSEGGVKANYFHALKKIKEYMQKVYAL